MARIEPYLSPSRAGSVEDLSLGLVNQWMRELRAVPYAYSLQWRKPEEVAHDPAADCKGKAVSLYQRMQNNGAREIRLVIGRRAPTSRATHTWVEWNTGAETYVLDPTLSSVACEANTLPAEYYTPYFIYAGGKKYRAIAADALWARL